MEKQIMNIDGEEMTMDQKFQKLEEITKDVLDEKKGEIERKAVAKLRENLFKKKEAVKEKPISILKRLDAHHKKNDGDENVGGGGKQFCNTIFVKIFLQNVEDPNLIE